MTDRWEYLTITTWSTYSKAAGWTTKLWIYRPGDPDSESREDPRITDVLNELGAQGWELVTVVVRGSIAFDQHLDQSTAPPTYHAARSYPGSMGYLFKRPSQR